MYPTPLDRFDQKIWPVLKNQPCDIGLPPTPSSTPPFKHTNTHLHASIPQGFFCGEGLGRFPYYSTNWLVPWCSLLSFCPINVDFVICMQFLAILFKLPLVKNQVFKGEIYPPVLLRKKVIALSLRSVEKMQVKNEFKLLKDVNLNNSFKTFHLLLFQQKM